MQSFDVDRFIDLSGAIRLEDIDWQACGRIGITEAEARILRYIGDTETHTIIYMRDLLAGHSAKDPEITSFLAVWVYEELWHGRALSRVLAECGWPEERDRFTKVTENSSIRELIEMLLATLAASVTPRFIAAHMTWGAINEITTAVAYETLLSRTQNPVLAEILRRIIRQERKHFAFYYSQAKKRLEGDRRAQALATFILRRFWTPVGSGVGGWDNLSFVAASLFGDDEARKPLFAAQDRIRELPGMEWFEMLTTQVTDLATRSQ